MWYAIQTMTGREQELIDSIEDRTDHSVYKSCFFVRREAVWRRGGQCITHVETLFPGYVFIDTETPMELYFQLRKVPKFSKLLGKDVSPAHLAVREAEAAEQARGGGDGDKVKDKNGDKDRDRAGNRADGASVGGNGSGKAEVGERTRRDEGKAKTPGGRDGPAGADADKDRGANVDGDKSHKAANFRIDGDNEVVFHPVTEEEREVIERLIDGDPERIVRLSPIELDDNSEIIHCGGALRHYKDAVIKKRIRLRYVIVRVPFLGRNRDIRLGIRLEKERICNALDMPD